MWHLSSASFISSGSELRTRELHRRPWWPGTDSESTDCFVALKKREEPWAKTVGAEPASIMYLMCCDFSLQTYFTYIYIYIYTSSTAQGGGGSFKNRKPIGEIGCCESGMAERIHWWTERCLRSPLFLSLSLTIYLPTSLSSMYLSIYLSVSIYLSISIYINSISIYIYHIDRSIYLSIYISLSLSSVYLASCLPVYLSIYRSIYLSVCLSICLAVYLSIRLSVYLSICGAVSFSVM